MTFQLTVLLLLLAGCQSDSSFTNEASAQLRSNSANGITVSTEEEVYTTSSKTITVLIQNDSPEEYTTGVHVFLEKKVDGIWYQFPMKADAFTEQAIGHPPGETSSLDLKVEDLKYTLTPGEYRATIGTIAAPFEVIE